MDPELTMEGNLLIDRLNKMFIDPQEEPSEVTAAYINALQTVHDGILTNSWGHYDSLMREIVITGHKVIAENRVFRHRLKEAIDQLVKRELTAGKISFGRAR